MSRISVRKVSSTAWFFAACTCCTGIFYEREARRRAKEKRDSQVYSSSISVNDIESCSGSPTTKKFSDFSGTDSVNQQGFCMSPAPKEFVSSHQTMWMDSGIPLESLVVNVRARIILILNNILGWVCWSTMIFLAFYYQFFTLHDHQFSYLNQPLLISLCLNAAELILAFIAIFSKKVYRTPFLMSLSSILTMLTTTICAFLVENDELFFAGTGMAAVQLLHWVAFTTGYGAVVSKWLHPFVIDEEKSPKTALDQEDFKVSDK